MKEVSVDRVSLSCLLKIFLEDVVLTLICPVLPPYNNVKDAFLLQRRPDGRGE